MAKRRKNDKNATAFLFKIWGGVKIILLILVSAAIGWNVGYKSGQEDTRRAVNSSSSSSETSPSNTETETDNTDDYGRSPGHQHYGHNHP